MLFIYSTINYLTDISFLKRSPETFAEYIKKMFRTSVRKRRITLTSMHFWRLACDDFEGRYLENKPR